MFPQLVAVGAAAVSEWLRGLTTRNNRSIASEVVKELQKSSRRGRGTSEYQTDSSDFDKGGRGATRAGNDFTASAESLAQRIRWLFNFMVIQEKRSVLYLMIV